MRFWIRLFKGLNRRHNLPCPRSLRTGRRRVCLAWLLEDSIERCAEFMQGEPLLQEIGHPKLPGLILHVLSPSSCQDDDGRVWLDRANLPEHVDAGDIGQVQVENGQIGVILATQLNGL